jgi:hypothetical protein
MPHVPIVSESTFGPLVSMLVNRMWFTPAARVTVTLTVRHTDQFPLGRNAMLGRTT